VLPVSTVPLVSLVLPTENKNHPSVHVQKDISNLMLLLPLVKSVPPTVLPVTQIQMSVTDVVLVPPTEKITHQPVPVKMVTMKTKTQPVNHVTHKDV